MAIPSKLGLGVLALALLGASLLVAEHYNQARGQVREQPLAAESGLAIREAQVEYLRVEEEARANLAVRQAAIDAAVAAAFVRARLSQEEYFLDAQGEARTWKFRPRPKPAAAGAATKPK